jgi:membrane associated rhomboid family serine protease
MANQLIEDIKYKIRNGNPVTRLIIINIAVFLILGIIRILTFSSGESSTMASAEEAIRNNLSLEMNWQGFFSKPWTLITYMFTQWFLQHLIWNMIVLFWFGEILSQFTNPRKIIPLYLMGGLVGGLFALVIISVLPLFNVYKDFQLIGSSGSVVAIVVAAATLVPNYRTTLPFIGPVKLLYVAIFVIFINILDVASYANIGGNLAHLGGALMGFFFIWQYKRGNDLAKPINQLRDWSGRTFSKGGSQMKVVHKRKVSDEEYNYSKAQTQKLVDEILDKISRSGYESLTKEEREILYKASKK